MADLCIEKKIYTRNHEIACAKTLEIIDTHSARLVLLLLLLLLLLDILLYCVLVIYIFLWWLIFPRFALLFI